MSYGFRLGEAPCPHILIIWMTNKIYALLDSVTLERKTDGRKDRQVCVSEVFSLVNPPKMTSSARPVESAPEVRCFSRPVNL